ncbi:MAG: FeoA family protein [Pseudomonadota bacterium]
MRLNELKKGRKAEVASIDSDDAALNAKLREVGFAEGDTVEMIEVGPVAGRPLCIRLNRTLIALRPEEAAAIGVSDPHTLDTESPAA